MLSVHTKSVLLTGHFGFAFEENHIVMVTPSFSKNSVLNCCRHTCRPGVFKFLRFEERFRKASFSRRISVEGNLVPRAFPLKVGPNRRNKAAFSNVDAASRSRC